MNNDGFLDVYIGTGTLDLRSIMPNRMLLNERGTRFHDVTLAGAFRHLQKGHAIAFADLDHDGDQDIYAVMGGAVEGDHYPNALYENPGLGADNAWVVSQLEGRTANRAAIGARIYLRFTDRNGVIRDIHGVVATGGSFGASSLRQAIGLGETELIDELTISCPNRNWPIDTYTNVDVNRDYRIVEGRFPEPMRVRPFSLSGKHRP